METSQTTQASSILQDKLGLDQASLDGLLRNAGRSPEQWLEESRRLDEQRNTAHRQADSETPSISLEERGATQNIDAQIAYAVERDEQEALALSLSEYPRVQLPHFQVDVDWASLLRAPYIGFAPADWGGFQLNFFATGQLVTLQRNMEAFDANDYRLQATNQNPLPLPLLYRYGTGGRDSTQGQHHACIQLPSFSDVSINALGLLAMKTKLDEKGINVADVPVYLNVRSLPVCEGTSNEGQDLQNINFNYFTHCWVHERMVGGAQANVETGVYAADGIVAGSDSVGINTLVSQNQNFHDNDHLSGNMHQLKFTAVDPTNQQSHVAMGWFLAIGPNNMAVICCEVINKGQAVFSDSALLLEEAAQRLRSSSEQNPQAVTDEMGRVTGAGPALRTKLESVFRGFGLI